MTILVTGGAGFIGSNFVLDWLEDLSEPVVNIDVLTYAGNLRNLETLSGDPRHIFIRADIGDVAKIRKVLASHTPRAVINFAAQSHVDRSIRNPDEFIQTNILGTYRLLESARNYWDELADQTRGEFRFLQVSTEEVYGSLEVGQEAFTEQSRYQPNNPYSASKASADHLVRAYYRTYDLPVLTTASSNNFGPYHHPEKLIPLTIYNALENRALPIYGDGQQVRDWLYVRDNCKAIRTVLEKGVVGETYNIGGWNEKTNLEVVHKVCDILNELNPRADRRSYRDQITFVEDRPGHDKRYAVDASKARKELAWNPKQSFESGMRNTVKWYLQNRDWMASAVGEQYTSWIKEQYD